MTDQEINIAIAEACGWESIWKDDRGNMRGFHMQHGADGNKRLVPFYITDLNAMHEAEKVLREMQTMTYIDRLGEIVSQGMGDGSYGEIWNMLHATARQRAEAFLRTLGKRKD